MRSGSCAQCEQLWRDYSHATTEHIRLTGKQRIAHLQGDRKTEDALEVEVAAAEAARNAARGAIREHEALAHDGTAEGMGREPQI